MLHTRLVLWLSIVLLPPFGIVLLWMRRLGVFKKILATVGIMILFGAELLFVYGMRIIWDGDFKPIAVTFARRATHYAKLEESRGKQRAEAPLAVFPAAVEAHAVSAAAKRNVITASGYWTDFRGPNRDGVYSQTAIDTSWPPGGLPLLWKQPVGGGYASFTVGEGRAYTIEQRRDNEAVTAYDVNTGRELWAFTYPAHFQEVMGGPGPRATPIYHDGLLYSLGASGDFYCLLAATGKPKWSKNILQDNEAKNVQWAMANSPLIIGEQVIVTPGGQGGKSLVSYNRMTGERLWGSLNDRAAYVTPIVATLAGQRQIVWISGERAVGLTVDGGKLLWEYPFTAQFDMNCSQPVIVDPSHVLLSSAMGAGAAMLEITKSGEALAARALWTNNRMKNKFNSSVLYEGYIYGLDNDILACIDPKTGELKWKGGRYGFGQVLLASGHLVVTTERGELVLVRATPQSHQELARFQAIEGRTWNVPAIDNGLILVRNDEQMACFRIGKGT